MTTPLCTKCNSEFVYSDGSLFICPDCGHEFSQGTLAGEQVGLEDSGGSIIKVLDAHGNELANGDSIIVVKDLKIKGSSEVVKVGSKAKNIRLIEGDHNIDCKIEGQGKIQLKSEYVKKA